jgi:hypothetical protein
MSAFAFIESGVVVVPLTKGYKATVSVEDFHLVAGRKWHALEDKRKDGSVRAVYAAYGVRAGRKNLKTIRLHRLILGVADGIEVDHVDGNGLNNLRSNLRAATKAQNMFNRRKCVRNTSGVKGVHPTPNGKWRAVIRVNGKLRSLGTFAELPAAADAYAKASASMHGAFGRTA